MARPRLSGTVHIGQPIRYREVPRELGSPRGPTLRHFQFVRNRAFAACSVGACHRSARYPHERFFESGKGAHARHADHFFALHCQFRISGRSSLITLGVAALGSEAVERIFKTIAVFDDFCHANDPHEEHDFGSFEADGHMIMFKIDYYDQNLAMHSPDPADPAVTQRVITIMLAEEY
jgi:Protein of unknown function (DUF3768)